MPYIEGIVETDKAQALSEGGGNHITITADDLQGTDIEDVTSGDLVVLDTGLAGVALIDYDEDNEWIVIDIAGGHYLPVTATAIAIGERIYYDKTNEILHDDGAEETYNADVCIGFALERASGSSPLTVRVKLQPFGESE